MARAKAAIGRLPFALQRLALRGLYWKNGKRLEDVQQFPGGFYAYKVEGRYVPGETLSWFLDFEYYRSRISEGATWAYTPRLGNVVVDLGAGIGEETIVLSEMVGKQGKVIAIEANPDVCNFLLALVRLNELSNVEVHNVAISDADAPVDIEIVSYLASSIGSSGRGKMVKVPGVRIDTFLRQHGLEKVDLLKANIEGAERFLVQAVRERATAVEHYAISCHDFRFKAEGNPFFRTRDLVEDGLCAAGLDVTSQSSGIPYIDDWVYASRTTW